jgi:hypothetical protein
VGHKVSAPSPALIAAIRLYLEAYDSGTSAEQAGALYELRGIGRHDRSHLAVLVHRYTTLAMDRAYREPFYDKAAYYARQAATRDQLLADLRAAVEEVNA